MLQLCPIGLKSKVIVFRKINNSNEDVGYEVIDKFILLGLAFYKL